jgi:drug/metabolite transporter (DMT)-like permease
MSDDLAQHRLLAQKALSPVRLVYAALTASAFFWGAGFAVARFVLRQISPLDLLAGQALLAAVVEAAWIAARGRWRTLRLPAPLLWPVIVLGLLGQNILNGLSFFGLTFTSATDAALIYGFSPALIGVFAAAFLAEPFSTWMRRGAVVGFLGVALIITQGRLESVLQGTMLGNVLILGGALYWAGYAVATRSLAQRIGPEVFTFYILLLGAILPLGWVYVTERRLPLASHGTSVLLAMIFLGVGTSVLAMNFWSWGLSRIEASRVGVFSYLEPVFAGLVAIAFLGERPTLPTVTGAVLVFAGIFLATKRQ